MTIGWRVAELRPVDTGNKLLPKTATNCCGKRQQIGNKLLPFLEAICCRFRQQFVAVSGNNLLPKMATKLPVWTGLYGHLKFFTLWPENGHRTPETGHGCDFICCQCCYAVHWTDNKHSNCSSISSNIYTFRQIYKQDSPSSVIASEATNLLS